MRRGFLTPGGVVGSARDFGTDNFGELCLGWWDLLDGAGGSDTASYLDVTKVIADRERQRKHRTRQ